MNYAWSKGGRRSSPLPGTALPRHRSIPPTYANVMAVAATTDLDKLASFSDYGDWVDVAAPRDQHLLDDPRRLRLHRRGLDRLARSPPVSPRFSSRRRTDTNGNGLLNDEVRSRIQSTADNMRIVRASAAAASTPTARSPEQARLRRPPRRRTRRSRPSRATPSQARRSPPRAGTWTNSPTSYGYQWLRCDTSGASCTSIPGATLSAYMLAAADADSTVRARVTATNGAGFSLLQPARRPRSSPTARPHPRARRRPRSRARPWTARRFRPRTAPGRTTRRAMRTRGCAAIPPARAAPRSRARRPRATCSRAPTSARRSTRR